MFKEYSRRIREEYLSQRMECLFQSLGQLIQVHSVPDRLTSRCNKRILHHAYSLSFVLERGNNSELCAVIFPFRSACSLLIPIVVWRKLFLFYRN